MEADRPARFHNQVGPAWTRAMDSLAVSWTALEDMRHLGVSRPSERGVKRAEGREFGPLCQVGSASLASCQKSTT